MTFSSFRDFVEQRVLPAQSDNPEHIRLDGRTSGGNREIFAKFRHRGKLWKVHSDTHFEPLMLAYDAILTGETSDPFDEVVTSRTGSVCLMLLSEIHARMKRPRFKYLYIYEVP
jgi:hypothetical protein